MKVEEIALEYLNAGGKRLRPRLCEAVYRSLAPEGTADLRPLKEAIECFHKASLVHDDIQDGDEERYGRPTVWKQYGVPAAIAIGDWLVAHGYELIVQSGFANAAAMLEATATSHRRLSEGQGDELLGSTDYLSICERKTGEAFALAATLGALAAGADPAPYREWGLVFGILFQIRDDLRDVGESEDLLRQKDEYEHQLTVLEKKWVKSKFGGWSMKCVSMSWMMVLTVAGSVACTAAAVEPECVDGIYPHLAMFNDEGECGTGAVVPWAGSLWVMTYGPHCPVGSSDRLYQITPDLKQVIRPESIGGTHANRLVHRASGQVLMGPYLIDSQGNVRVVPIAAMPGRLTGTALDWTDPDKVYVTDMEEALYRLDVKTLATETLIRDGHNGKAFRDYFRRTGATPPPGWNTAEESHLFGYHGKGTCSGFGKVFYCNNGQCSPQAMKDPFTPSGCLAEWRPGDRQWHLIRTNQFTEVTTRDGVCGNEHPGTNPIWALGWDAKSVILTVTTNGTDWVDYRLPKASHCYDGAHGWNTEWPRIRDIGEKDLLATMHGTFWRFPRDFSPASPNGIRPRSTYLKVIGDFCRWRDRIVFGCDDQAQNEFLGKRALKKDAPKRDRSQSNLWFVKPAELDAFGPPSGEGWVWWKEDVKAGAVSDPFLFAGYDEMRFTFTDGAGRPVRHELLHEGDWVRVKALEDVKGASAHFRYGPKRPAKLPAYDGFIEVKDDAGDVYRFPNVNGDKTVICREVATERDLLYVGGVFYEVPADNAGGFKVLRPIALASEPVHSIEAKLGLVYINGRPIALDTLWRNGTAPAAYWLWETKSR